MNPVPTSTARLSEPVQCVAQYPDSTSIRTLKKKNSIFEAPFSVLGKRSISNES